MLPDITNYIPDPNNGRPIANGQVYFFIDGYTPPTNINDVNPAYVAEVTAGGAVLPQPIYTTQGGVLRTGSLANMPQVNVSTLVKRVAVYDKCGALIYSTAYNGVGAFVDVDALAEVGSEVLIGGTPAGVVGRNIADNVSVFDFMTQEQIDDVKAGTLLIDVTDACNNAIDTASRVYFPKGSYLISRALRLNQSSGRLIYGDGKEQTIIVRYDTTEETIDGVACKAVVFWNRGDHRMSDMQLLGYPTRESISYPLDGIVADNMFRGKIENVMINRTRRGIRPEIAWTMTLQSVLVRECSETSYDFSSAEGKTSLHFVNCLCENVANAFILKSCTYSTMTCCGVDYANYTPTDNPYGTGYGDRASPYGIYHIIDGDVAMNGCGAEYSYGNGYVNLGEDFSTSVVVNAGTCFDVKSTHVPASGWAVGPFQTGNGPISLTINSGRYNFSNTTAPLVAPLVAFNYDESGYGRRERTLVNVTSVTVPGDLSDPFAGAGDYVYYCRIANNIDNTYRKKLSGTGATITIPITSQNAAEERHLLKICAINDDSNSQLSLVTEASIEFTSLNVVRNIQTWGLRNVSSVTASGMNLVITLTAGLTAPYVKIKCLSTSQRLVDFNSMSLT